MICYSANPLMRDGANAAVPNSQNVTPTRRFILDSLIFLAARWRIGGATPPCKCNRANAVLKRDIRLYRSAAC